MNISVGSVCVTINKNGFLYPEFVGLECTVSGGRARRLTTDNKGNKGYLDCYVAEFPNKGQYLVAHENLIVKKFPPNTDAWLREKMDDLLNKVPDNILKEDLV
jgi:hypothetical protein